VVIGEDEFEQGTCQLKNMKTGETVHCAAGEIALHVKESHDLTRCDTE